MYQKYMKSKRNVFKWLFFIKRCKIQRVRNIVGLLSGFRPSRIWPERGSIFLWEKFRKQLKKKIFFFLLLNWYLRKITLEYKWQKGNRTIIASTVSAHKVHFTHFLHAFSSLESNRKTASYVQGVQTSFEYSSQQYFREHQSNVKLQFQWTKRTTFIYSIRTF